MNTRSIVVLLAGLLVGLWIGRASPQAALRTARAEIERLKEAGRQRPQAARQAMAGVESMLNVRREDVADARRARRARAETNRVVAVAQTGAVAAAASAPAVAQPGGLSNELERVRQAWDLRRDIARKNFVERTGLEPEKAAQFDVLIEAMNLRLGATVDRWAEAIRKDENFTAETGARMMHELSEAVVITYDEMDRKLPAGWREQAGPRFELVRFVDPEVLTPFQDLESIMERADFGQDEETPPAPGAVPP
jgi:hypothetical protein